MLLALAVEIISDLSIIQCPCIVRYTLSSSIFFRSSENHSSLTASRRKKVDFPVKLTLSKDMDKELKELQKQFMPEDTKAGLIQSFLDNFKGTQVCSKLIYAEALNHPFDEPKQWEIREINEIMNNSIEGWRPFSNPRSFAKYGRQRGWERIPPPDNEPSATGSNLTDGFRELTEEEARQMELPF